jgi:hypothetical protein
MTIWAVCDDRNVYDGPDVLMPVRCNGVVRVVNDGLYDGGFLQRPSCLISVMSMMTLKRERFVMFMISEPTLYCPPRLSGTGRRTFPHSCAAVSCSVWSGPSCNIEIFGDHLQREGTTLLLQIL